MKMTVRIAITAALLAIPFSAIAAKSAAAPAETAVAIYRGINDSGPAELKFRMPDRKIRHFTVNPENAQVCRLVGGFGRNYRITFDPQRNEIKSIEFLSRDAQADAERMNLAKQSDAGRCVAAMRHDMHED